jgi:hypothetical protein
MADVRTTLILSATLLAGLVGGGYVFRDHLLPADPHTPGEASQDKSSSSESSDAAKQGRVFVNNLTKRRPKPIAIDRADDFITKDQPVSLPKQESVQEIKPAERIQQSKFDSDVIASPVNEIDQGVQTRRLDNQLELVTSEQLAADSVLVDQTVRIQRSAHPADVVSVGELLEQHGGQVGPDDLFYVHTVQELDDQGIWGIIQNGVVRTFAQGIAVGLDPAPDIIKVDIPQDADERLADESSSFLGKLIYEKTIQSYVYNFTQHRMGRNPDVLRPNQEIVIVSFRPSELITIYRHFRNQG